jgi:hypothetical protein
VNALQRLIAKILPPPVVNTGCDHAATIAALTADRHQATRVGVYLEAQFDRLRAEHDELLKEHVDLVLAVTSAHTCYEPAQTTPVQLLAMEREQHAQQLTDLAGRIEEANSQIAVLEQHMRETGRQAKFDLGAVTGADSAGESPIAEDEVIYDKVIRLAFGLVGVYFDEGKHFWLLQRNDERVKCPIRDKVFLERVKHGEESFRAGDALVVEVHTITRRAARDGKVYVEYVSIDKVVSLVHADEKIALPLGEEEVASVEAH